jgi:hypothetical protein
LQKTLQNVNKFLKTKSVKSAFVLLGISLVLLLSVLGASPSLHKLLHSDADQADHHCVITLFTKGQVIPATAAQSLAIVVILFGGVALLAETFLLPTTDYCISSSRAPPSSCF